MRAFAYYGSTRLHLNASYPIYANATRYFTIRRATNDTQYTLGRAFLQEAYVVTDYENKNFTVAQANFSATMPTSQIVPIVSGYKSHCISNCSGLSKGAIVGIAVGAILVVAIGIIDVLMCLRRRKRQSIRAATSANDSVGDINETRVEGLDNELTTDSAKYELLNRHPHHELHGDTTKWGRSGVQELYCDIPSPEELGGDALAEPPKEAEGSPGRVFELPGTESDRRIHLQKRQVI
ncbi:hypothetical protein BDV97DRAFT_372648 [Delphinella strobiligena]|nr:hypothetical protein BDV97DRAFT_372648 [Delphinella strobiligena]